MCRHVQHKRSRDFTVVASFEGLSRKHVALLSTGQGTCVDGRVLLWELLCGDTWQLCWRLQPLAPLAPDSIQKVLQRMLRRSVLLLH